MSVPHGCLKRGGKPGVTGEEVFQCQRQALALAFLNKPQPVGLMVTVYAWPLSVSSRFSGLSSGVMACTSGRGNGVTQFPYGPGSSIPEAQDLINRH